MTDQVQSGYYTQSPVHDLEAEGGVIGSVLLDNAALTRVATFLRPMDFYTERNRLVYQAMLDLLGSSRAIDLVTLADQLSRQRDLDRIGGRSYLAMLAQDTPTAANVEHYAGIVHRASRKRQLLGVVRETTVEAEKISTDVDQLLSNLQQKLILLGAGDAREDFTAVGDGQVDDLVMRLSAAMESGGVTGVPSGFRDLDKLTGGFRRSELTYIAGRPGMGKSSIMTNIALHLTLAENPIPVGIFSLEMSKENLVERLISEVTEIDGKLIRDGHLTPSQYESVVRACGPLAQAPLYIDDSTDIDDLGLLSKARRLHARLKDGLGLVMLDYVQLYQGDTGGGANREQEVSRFSKGLRRVARDLDIPVLGLAQLSRAPELRQDKRPMLSDLRETGALENDADLVIFLYRDDYYNPRSEDKGICEVNIAKHRNGPTGTIKLVFEKHLTRFRDLY